MILNDDSYKEGRVAFNRLADDSPALKRARGLRQLVALTHTTDAGDL